LTYHSCLKPWSSLRINRL